VLMRIVIVDTSNAGTIVAGELVVRCRAVDRSNVCVCSRLCRIGLNKARLWLFTSSGKQNGGQRQGAVQLNYHIRFRISLRN